MNVAGIGDGSGYGGLADGAPAGGTAAPLRGGGGQAGDFGGDVFEPSVTGLEAEVGAAELGRIRSALAQIVEMSPVSEGEADPIRGVLRQVEAAMRASGTEPAPARGMGAAAWVSEAAEDGEVSKLLREERPSVLDAALVKLAVYEKAVPGLVEGGTDVVRAGPQVTDAALVASGLGAAEAARLASQFELARRVEAGLPRGVLERPRLAARAGLTESDGGRRRRSRRTGGRPGERRRRERRGRVGLAAFCAAVGRAGWAWWRRLFEGREREPERRGFASAYRGEE